MAKCNYFIVIILQSKQIRAITKLRTGTQDPKKELLDICGFKMHIRTVCGKKVLMLPQSWYLTPAHRVRK